MKNTILSVLLALVVLSSCSKSSGDETQPVILNAPENSIKKITETVYYTPSGTTYSVNFEYELGVLKRYFGANTKTEFEYLGNKIISAKSYNNNILQRSNTLSYLGDNLISVLADNGEKTEFTYSGNTLSSMANGSVSGAIFVANESQIYSFNSSNNLIQLIKNNSFGGSQNSYKSAFTFDTANNPFKMMNPYLRLVLSYESIDILSKNNKTQTFAFTSPTGTTSTQTEYYNIIYNSQNYPTSIKKKRFTTNELVSEMTIEYN